MPVGEQPQNDASEGRSRAPVESGKADAEREAQLRIDALLRSVLEEDAKSRLANVKLVNRELYYKAVQAIVYLYNSGRASGRLSDGELRGLLSKLSVKREVTIRRK